MTVGFVDAGIGMAEDVFLICISTVELHKLKMTRHQRVFLSAVFAMAISAMLASAMGLKNLLKVSTTYDSTWDSVDLVVWSTIQLLLTILIGSLPAFDPWVSRITSRSSVPCNHPDAVKNGSSIQATTIVVQHEEKNEHGRPSMSVHNIPPRFSGTTKTASFAMSAIPSFRSSDYWEVRESPLMIPTSKFQDSAVALPPPTYYKRWSQQPDSPTDPNVLAKYTSLYLTRVASEDLESNCSRDTWILRDSYSQRGGERVSSRLARY
ncbi:hypothetical protein PFICI_04125 [Pestalotiopsis fici W106-1]|uniref:Rhodopsin domain-containing protein n=1 Tax=Pestalotiopsis fici (strain W106-1 / CGMCC3.15140) TaxID=1229662 RepID=W3XJA8_PESFW|nr:uncharacterized protein PFICI_04125 [Pestalotiopsis fici W106-1]ETS86100.1 hypothetical protein PFICI_04125 [Pestalotiopsis fici W106-1]